MSQTPDVLIVGAGVIGLTSAYFLAQDGVRVQVVDRSEAGQEASWAGAGILPPGNPTFARSPFDQLRAHSAQLFPTLSRQLLDETGIDNGYRRSGGIEFHQDVGHAHDEEWRGEGVEAQSLNESDLLKLEPALASGLGAATFLPDMAQVRNPRHLQALSAACRKLGVEIRTGCEVVGWQRQGSRIVGLETAQGRMLADRFLLSAGAWSETLLKPLGLSIGIAPVRGQILLLHPERRLFQRMLLWGARYLVPREEGRVLVGSTEEHVGFEKATTQDAQANLRALACRLVPELASAPIEKAWSGLRPGSPDGMPFLGAAPGFDNLWIAAGHFRAGLQLSPGTGMIMKALLLRQTPILDVQAFRVDR